MTPKRRPPLPTPPPNLVGREWDTELRPVPVQPLPPVVVTAEAPEHHVRNALQILTLARYGQTELGKPARVLTDEEFRGIIARLSQAVRQLEAPKVGV